MREFEERQREIFRAHLKTNVAEFSKTSSDTLTILSTRKLTGRSSAQHIAQSLMIARQPAWAAISVALHAQLKQLVRETAAHLGTKYAVIVPIDLRSTVDEPVMGTTLPRWFHGAELAEHQRVIKALRLGYGVNSNPLEAFTQAAPYSTSNSAVSAITVTSATAVMNRVALEIYRLANFKRYKLETNGPVKYHEAYEREYGVDESPQAPMFIGDRSYPVPS